MRSIHPNSVAAYWQGNEELFGQRHQKVIAALRASAISLTDREIMIRCGFTDMNAVRPRITELIDCGIAIPCGSIECPITHKTVRKVQLRKFEPQPQFEMTEILTPSVVAKLSQRSA